MTRTQSGPNPISEEEFMSCRTNCCKTFLFVFVLLAMAVLATPAFGQTCLQQEYNQVNHQNLNCTANDVRVAKVINVRDPQSGVPITTCTPGTFPFTADFLVQTTSSSSRSNIGLYFQTDPTAANALTGTCSDNIITATNSTHYEELDPQSNSKGPVPDNCGDTSSNDPTVCLNSSNQVAACTAAQQANCTAANNCFTGTQVVTVSISNFICPNVPNGTQLNLPNCTSWQVPGSTIQCNSNDGTYQGSFLNGKPTAIPGSPSKCNCSSIPLGITVQSPGVDVTKDCTIPGNSPAQDHLSKCTFGTTNVEGGDVVYTVGITNKSNFGDSLVDQICDNQYGTISDDGTLSACAAGNYCKAKCTGVNTPFQGCTGTGTASAGTTCIKSTTCTTPLDVNGTPASCTFTVTQPEISDITDIVNVSGHGSTSSTLTFGPTPSGSVEVVSGEAPSTASITKAYDSTLAACATVRYKVDVQNTSGFDESLSLTGLNDSVYGNLTSCTNTGCTNTGGDIILGTNCGLAAGVGTLQSPATPPTGFTGATFGSIATNGHYKCAFDAQFCGPLDPTTLCFQKSDRVSGSFTGDEGETGTSFITVNNNLLTVKECLQPATVTSGP
jgi:hypothetical protein